MWERLRRWAAKRQIRRFGDHDFIVLRGVTAIAVGIEHVQRRAAEGKQTLLLGVMYDRMAKRWHLGLSRSGQDLVWICAHQSYYQIENLIAWISYTARQNNLEDDATFQVFLSEAVTWGEG